MKLSELKVGDKFRFVDSDTVEELTCEPRIRGMDGMQESVRWSPHAGYRYCFSDEEVTPIPKHEYKVGEWVQCDSIDGIQDRNLSFIRVGQKYKVESLLEHFGMFSAQMRNTKGDCDAVYYLLDRFSPTEEPKPQYKPYSDLRVLVGQRIKWKDDGEVRLVVQATESTCWTINGDGDAMEYDRKEMLEMTTHIDGTPCGELVE